jgi:hypothetical protein
MVPEKEVKAGYSYNSAYCLLMTSLTSCPSQVCFVVIALYIALWFEIFIDNAEIKKKY